MGSNVYLSSSLEDSVTNTIKKEDIEPDESDSNPFLPHSSVECPFITRGSHNVKIKKEEDAGDCKGFISFTCTSSYFICNGTHMSLIVISDILY